MRYRAALVRTIDAFPLPFAAVIAESRNRIGMAPGFRLRPRTGKNRSADRVSGLCVSVA